MRWDAAHVIVYLPLTSRWHSPERMCFSTHSLSHSFFFLPLILSRITPMALFSIWTRFLVQNVQHEVRGKQVRLPERQNGTWAGAMENQVVVRVRPYVCSQTRSVWTDCVTLDSISEAACFVSICYSKSQSTTYLKHLTHLLFFWGHRIIKISSWAAVHWPPPP